MTDANKLLKECRKVLLADSHQRNMNKDLIQRIGDFLRKQEKAKEPK